MQRELSPAASSSPALPSDRRGNLWLFIYLAGSPAALLNPPQLFFSCLKHFFVFCRRWFWCPTIVGSLENLFRNTMENLVTWEEVVILVSHQVAAFQCIYHHFNPEPYVIFFFIVVVKHCIPLLLLRYPTINWKLFRPWHFKCLICASMSFFPVWTEQTCALRLSRGPTLVLSTVKQWPGEQIFWVELMFYNSSLAGD